MVIFWNSVLIWSSPCCMVVWYERSNRWGGGAIAQQLRKMAIIPIINQFDANNWRITEVCNFIASCTKALFYTACCENSLFHFKPWQRYVIFWVNFIRNGCSREGASNQTLVRGARKVKKTRVLIGKTIFSSIHLRSSLFPALKPWRAFAFQSPQARIEVSGQCQE